MEEANPTDTAEAMSIESASLTLRRSGLCDPALGANAFPEVTRLVCRLPLPTLFYRLEASSLGDRMRISVRSVTRGEKIAAGFSMQGVWALFRRSGIREALLHQNPCLLLNGDSMVS